MADKPNLAFLKNIGPNEALIFLRRLAEEDPEVARKLETMAASSSEDLFIDGVAAEVRQALNDIDPQAAWKTRAAEREDHATPDDLVWRLFEETLKPFLAEIMDRRNPLGPGRATQKCMGILKGLWLHHQDLDRNASDASKRAPVEFFHAVLETWQERNQNMRDIKAMGTFIKKHFKKWTT